jgi:hypothetical protein
MLYLLPFACTAIGVLCSMTLSNIFARSSTSADSFRASRFRSPASLGVAFLIAEVCVRLAMASLSANDTQPTSFDAELGWSRPPGNRVAPNPDLGSVGTDSLIVFVGDSVAFGQGVAPEHGMVHQTRLHLGGHGKAVLNAAVPGYGIDQAYLYVKRHLPAWEKLETVVWVLFAGNDMVDTAANMRYGHDKPLFRYADGGLRRGAGRLSPYSVRNLLSESRLIYSFEALNPRFSSFVDGLSGQVVLGEQEAREVVQALLADLLHETGKQGVETLLVLIPAKEDFTAPSPSFLWLEGALQRSDGRLLSFLPLLQSRGITADSFFLAGDPWHLSVEGNRIAAGLIAEAILDLPRPGSVDRRFRP